MCSAYSAADASVSHTPRSTDTPLSDSSASPAVDSATASQTMPAMRWRSSSIARIGVNTTYMPVANPLTLGAISDSPQVCSSWPAP